MYPLLLYDHWGLIYRKSWVYTRKSKMSCESCSTCYSTQESDGFSNMDPPFLCDHWGPGLIQKILGMHSKIQNERGEL